MDSVLGTKTAQNRIILAAIFGTVSGAVLRTCIGQFQCTPENISFGRPGEGKGVWGAKEGGNSRNTERGEGEEKRGSKSRLDPPLLLLLVPAFRPYIAPSASLPPPLPRGLLTPSATILQGLF